MKTKSIIRLHRGLAVFCCLSICFQLLGAETKPATSQPSATAKPLAMPSDIPVEPKLTTSPVAPKPLAMPTKERGSATKIGYIKVEKIITPDLTQATYHEWIDRVKELQAEMESRYAKLAAVHQKIKEDEAELVRKNKLIDEKARIEQEKHLARRNRDLSGDAEALNVDRQQALQTLQTEIFAKVEKAARDLATKPGKELDLILYAGGIYVSENIDITDELIQLLNKEYDAEQALKAKKAAAKPAEPSKK